MLILPHEHRAPFIAPGRRNRKVHWNRPLSRAINSLGKYEKEDWRRALWLPESLRHFYPRWNNQFSPGGSTCGCCESGECANSEQCHEDSADVEVDIPFLFTDSLCPDCDTIGGTYILSEGSPNSFTYSDTVSCDLLINLLIGCDPTSHLCVYTLQVNLSAAPTCTTTRAYEYAIGEVPVTLPLELPFDSDSNSSPFKCCDFAAGTDPAFITDFVP